MRAPPVLNKRHGGDRIYHALALEVVRSEELGPFRRRRSRTLNDVSLEPRYRNLLHRHTYNRWFAEFSRPRQLTILTWQKDG